MFVSSRQNTVMVNSEIESFRNWEFWCSSSSSSSSSICTRCSKSNSH